MALLLHWLVVAVASFRARSSTERSDLLQVMPLDEWLSSMAVFIESLVPVLSAQAFR